MTDVARLTSALAERYRIERELGGGGMSRVFVAEETALGRTVVIKVVAPEVTEGLSSERFAREVKLAARLQQANIVPVLSAGVAGGVPYYTMPFVRGESLRSHLALGERISVNDALHILRDVARALAYAHGEGVVHRDIKPDNILLSGGAAVVTDFGIAKALSASRTADGTGAPSTSGTLTHAGLAIGTPAYTAPEQAAGDPTTDHRADIYAWGIVAWELLAGKHPFSHCTTPQSLIAAHLRDTPAPLITARRDVPVALSDLVARCLEKDISRRPASATELLAALDRVATPDGQALRAAGLSRARPAWLVAAAVLAIAAFGAWLATRGGPASGTTAGRTSLAVLPFVSVGADTADPYFGEGMADEVAAALAKVPGIQLASRNSANALRGTLATVQEIGRSLQVAAVLQGSVRRAGNRMRVSAELTNAGNGIVMWADVYERELEDVFAVQDDIAREIVGALRVTLGGSASGAPAASRGTANLAAYDDYLRGLYFYQRRGVAIPKAVEAFSAAIAKDSSFARACAGLGLALTAMTIYTNTPARVVLPRALAMAERAVALDSTLAEAFLAKGNALAYAFRWAQAEDAYRRSIALDSTLAFSRLWYGRFLWVVGRLDQSIEQLQRANTLDPLSAVNPASFAYALAAKGRYSEAVAAGRRAFEMDSTLLGAQSGLVLTMVAAGQTADAREVGERVMRASTEISGRGIAAFALGRGGDVIGAHALIAELEQRKHEWRSVAALLRAYSGVADTTGMFTAMERGLAVGEPFPLTTSFADALYDPVRNSPRFVSLVTRVGLDPARFTFAALGRTR